MEIVRRNTPLVAEHFAQGRGQAGPGAWADVAVIDLESYDWNRKRWILKSHDHGDGRGFRPGQRQGGY